MCPLGARPPSVIRHLVTMQGDRGEKHSITVAWIPDSYLQELGDLHDITRGYSHLPQDSTLGVFQISYSCPDQVTTTVFDYLQLFLVQLIKNKKVLCIFYC